MEARREGLGLERRYSGSWVSRADGDKIMEEIKGFGLPRLLPLCGCNELMIIGQGCANADTPDDMHFLSDKLAVIQSERRDHSDMSVEVFFFSTLLKSSPKIFNTETGDYGYVETKHCGCAFERLGFTRHIHTVRSLRKTTAEGPPFVGSDLDSACAAPSLPHSAATPPTTSFWRRPTRTASPAFTSWSVPNWGRSTRRGYARSSSRP